MPNVMNPRNGNRRCGGPDPLVTYGPVGSAPCVAGMISRRADEPCVFPLSDGSDSGAPGSRSLGCGQRPHNLHAGVERPSCGLPPASRGESSVRGIPSPNASAISRRSPRLDAGAVPDHLSDLPRHARPGHVTSRDAVVRCMRGRIRLRLPVPVPELTRPDLDGFPTPEWLVPRHPCVNTSGRSL